MATRETAVNPFHDWFALLNTTLCAVGHAAISPDLFDGFRLVAAFRVDQTLSVRREADCRVREKESSCFIVWQATLIRRKAMRFAL